jgi:hypothetical protein
MRPLTAQGRCPILSDMSSTFFRAAAMAAVIGSSSTAEASEFDACVLQHMQGVTSDTAATSIKEACLRTVEIALPAEALQTLATARARYGSLPSFGPLPSNEGDAGLIITLNNNTGYTITELIVSIEDQKTHASTPYIIRLFPYLPPPGVIRGLPSDETTIEMLRPGQHQFYAAISERARDPNKWGDAYAWEIASAKGFRD